jgi:hypothetical protein
MKVSVLFFEKIFLGRPACRPPHFLDKGIDIPELGI